MQHKINRVLQGYGVSGSPLGGEGRLQRIAGGVKRDADGIADDLEDMTLARFRRLAARDVM